MAVAVLVSRFVKPVHTHDCKGCTFLGRLDDQDLYTCMQGGVGLTYIRRFGSDGPDYGSLGDHTPPGSAYAFAAKLDEIRKKTPTFRPCAWRIK